MARIETDPNYTAPTFSRATAATDLFKKEDVQALAAAMSVHDHSAGKGKTFPTGLITSAMIADGAVMGVDIGSAQIIGGHLADNCIDNSKIADGAVATDNLVLNAATRATIFGLNTGASTTSPTPVALPSAAITISVAGGTVYLWVLETFSCSIQNATIAFYINTDGAGFSSLLRYSQPLANALVAVSGVFHLAGLSAGNHTLQLGWSTSAGTLTADAGTNLVMDALELKR